MQNRMLALNCDCPDSFQCQDSSFGLRKNLQVKYTNSPINSTSTIPNIINPMILPILTEFVACGVGAGQRKGKVTAKAVPHVKRSTLIPCMTKQVDRNATLYTDGFPVYDQMTRLGYKHLRIEHGAKVCVVGSIHTNSIEGFWSLVKRGITGVYHAISPKYLQSYIDEYTFRYNHRNDEKAMFKIVLNQITTS